MIKIVVVLCVIVSCLTVLLGLTLLITGSICAANIDHLQQLWPELYVLSILSIIVGILAIFFASSLIYCIMNQTATGSRYFSYLLIAVIIFATICAIILLVGRSGLQSTVLDKTLTIFNNYSDVNKQNSNTVVDRIQQTLKCCGIRRAADWENLLSNKKSTPDSCCYFMIRDCGKDALNTLGDVYPNGCVQPIFQYLRKRYTMLIGMNFTLAIFAFISCGMGLYLQSNLRNRYDVM
jgi:hypothetical protein